VLAISDDGRFIAASEKNDRGYTLWDAADPAHPRLVATVPTTLAITGIAFDQGEHRLAVWSADAIEEWDITDPADPVAIAQINPLLIGTQDQVAGVQFLGAGQNLAIVSNDGINLYPTDPAAMAGLLCAATGASMTAVQWQDYAPGAPYAPGCATRAG